MKKILISTGVLAILTAGCASANTSAQHHYYIGIRGGGGIAVANGEGHYSYNTGTSLIRTQDFNNTSAAATGFVGFNTGYYWNLSSKNTLGVEAAFRYNFGTLNQSNTIDTFNTGNSESVDLKNKTKLRDQYDLALTESHMLTNDLSLTFRGGLSAIRIHNTLTPIDSEASTDTAASPTSTNQFLFGGVVGAGLKLKMSMHTALNFNVDYHIYAPRNLRTANVDTSTIPAGASTPTLSKRRIGLIMPSFSIGYSYCF